MAVTMGTLPRRMMTFKRNYSRSSSRKYLELWKEKNVDYVESFGTTGKAMQENKRLVQNIVKVESAMAGQGLVPFVHAMPASSRVPLAFYRALNRPKEFFHYLRSPFSKEFGPYEEMQGEVPSEMVRAPKPHLLSMSYALTCSLDPLESASSWGFINHFGRESYLPMHFRISELKIPPVFKARAMSLVCLANRLSNGLFLIIGVPKKNLSRWVYDSFPYNVPTGRKVEEVVQNPTLEQGGTIATMILSKETLCPNSGLVMAEANNETEVDRYCKGLAFQNWEFFEGAFRFSSGSVESEILLREKLDALLLEFKHWQNTGVEPKEPLEKILPSDMPEALP